MYEGPIQDLVDELNRLPGIGPKSAQRLAFHIVKAASLDAKRLAEAIVQAKERVRFCRECFGVSEGELCRFCADPTRDTTVVCVVEERSKDLVEVLDELFGVSPKVRATVREGTVLVEDDEPPPTPEAAEELLKAQFGAEVVDEG